MPRPKLYEVELTQHQNTQLRTIITKGTAKARTITRARILLLAAEQKHDKDVIEALGVGHSTVFNIRKRFALEGLKAAESRW